jgi:hypothetical protein
MDAITPYIFMIIGLVAIVLPFFPSTDKRSSLKESGEKAEGVIFRVEGRQGGPAVGAGTRGPIVQVRFVTRSKEWITGTVEQKYQVSFSGQYKEGDPVDIYYDPSDPKVFILDTKQSTMVGKLMFTVVGLVFIGIGVFKLFS